MKNTLLTTGTLLGILIPQIALGYITPEEVLLNRELYLPPSAREAQMRTDIQAQESDDRRAQEQEDYFDAQYPEEEEEFIEPELHESAPDEEVTLSEEDRTLLESLRLLTRVQDNQETTRLQQQILYLTGQQQNMHAGAPLAPTGAGSVLAVLTAVGAIVWTLWKARRSEKMTIVR